MQKKPYRAEGGGFEPPESCPSTVFKTVAFVRSATPPGKRDETSGEVRGSLNPRTQIIEPGVGFTLGIVDLDSNLLGLFAGDRIRAEELHVSLSGS